jgi:hypothetical protein
MVRTYHLREVAALFIPRRRGKYSTAEHSRDEYFVPILACLSDIFEKFITLSTSMHANSTNTIIVTDKMKACIGKLGLCRRKNVGHVFSFEGFCGAKQCGNK